MSLIGSFKACGQRYLSTGLILFVLSFANQTQATEFGPPLCLFQDLPLGVEIDLEAAGNFKYQIVNKSDEDEKYIIECQAPSGDHRSWEYGFEPLPDLAWCVMKEKDIVVPAQSTKFVSLVINIPNKPENYNRKFVCNVVLRPGTSQRLGVGLGFIARIMIETKSDDVHQASTQQQSIAHNPGKLLITGKPGSAFTASTQLLNCRDYDINFSRSQIMDFYPKDKFSHYQSNGYTLMPNQSWLKDFGVSTLKAQAQAAFTITGTIPADAKLGSKHEEIIFLKPSPVTKSETKTAEEQDTENLYNMSFLRVQYHVE